MCLTTLTQGPDPQEQGEGYKVFQEMGDGSLRSAYLLFNFENESEFYEFYQTNSWMPDSKHYVIHATNENAPYETGFHLFPNEDDAKLLAHSREKYSFDINPKYVVRKVKYRGVTAKGTQILYNPFTCDLEKTLIDATTIVAKEIFIEEDPGSQKINPLDP
jgi:hypothetical protein